MIRIITLVRASACIAAGAVGLAASHSCAGANSPSTTEIAETQDDHAGHGHGDDGHGDKDKHDHDHENGRDHKDHDRGGTDGHDAKKGHRHDDGHDHDDAEKADGHDGHDHGSEESHGDGHEHGDDGHSSHEGHDEHGGHDDHGSVGLSQEQMDRFDVRMVAVAGGPIPVTIERPAEVIYNENALAHVVPRVPGIARTVEANEGDQVAEGDVLAVLDSRALADAKAAYLASLERLALAKENFDRAEALVGKRIVSERTHLTAKTDFAEARINLRSARQKLLALGVGESRLQEIAEQDEADLTAHVMRAPLGGTVVTRHLSRGESVQTDREAFIIADVSTVWVDISIYVHDLERVAQGQIVTITTDGGLEAEGKIAFVTPNVSEETRTANARVELDNAPKHLRPGMFVTARIALAAESVDVRIPASALQTHEGQNVVFVRGGDDGALKPRPVTLGRSNGTHVEVVGGLKPGEAVVAEGAFLVKSQFAKSDFDDGHNH
ncbi:efflux RND transporter periplasmic adaptor subunit [Methyloceanibacter sp.]|uniref:efflux RND transporter periplasmic adaptor subunit n=1 Tax=Methyloceanibacter sp. TaxID=1965321 RepID=UPI002C13233E|nr:efflux RND transporter periplasmic adaptor subunit [Methyloceanibacter sp.]HML91918.1 efflux RND transporter periplasmic adaptor subunit [Methyloceanibacter sp.]